MRDEVLRIELTGTSDLPEYFDQVKRSIRLQLELQKAIRQIETDNPTTKFQYMLITTEEFAKNYGDWITWNNFPRTSRYSKYGTWVGGELNELRAMVICQEPDDKSLLKEGQTHMVLAIPIPESTTIT